MTKINRELVTILRDGVDFELICPFRFYFDTHSKNIKDLPSGILECEAENGGRFSVDIFIEIPKGFKTDFGSVPLAFQSFISPVGKPTKAYVLHDYLCTLSNKGEIPRKVADCVFLDAMKILKVGVVRRYVIYGGVRAFALFKSLKRRMNG